MSLDIMDDTQQDQDQDQEQDQAQDSGAQPRRGSRARKAVEKFQPVNGHTSKKRRLDEDDSAGEQESESDLSSEDEAPRRASKGGAKGKGKVGEGPKEKRAAKPKKAGAAGGSKKRKAAGPEAEVVHGEVGVKDDCALFNALLNPEIILNTTVEDWVEQYQASAGDETAERESVHELVLFFVRCCGLSVDVDEDEALDVDGIADVVERIEEESAKTTAAVYPLISKAKPLRAFRKNLNAFLPLFVETLSHTPLLYHTNKSTTHSTPLLPLISTWLHSMSTSALRPLRHTATYISLKINSALCAVAAEVNKDLSVRQRQREAEAKKTTGTTSAAQKKERVKEAERKVKEAHEQKMWLEGLMQETVDVVCVNRVRDSDAAIRTDTLKEIGVWIRTYSPLFADEVYLGYLSRGCNDPDSHARNETVKALATLYEKDSFATSHRNATHRLSSRLIEMAIRDVDVGVRVRALQTVTQIDSTGFLEDEEIAERSKVPQLLFDAEPRVRRAVGGFIDGLWRERAERLRAEWQGAVGNKKKRAKGIDAETMEGYLDRKALAGLLVETSEGLSEDGGETAAMTRAVAVAEALMPHVESLAAWEDLGEYLLLDHSSHDDDVWLLNEEEEGFMLRMLVACAKLEGEEEEEERTKTLMGMLPRLISKNQSDPARIGAILQLVGCMRLEQYIDARKISAYESLWDDITRQFLTQTTPALLASAIGAINTLSRTVALATQNDKKAGELGEALFVSLRDALADEDVATLSMDEDRLAAAAAILLRLSLLLRSRDVLDLMEDEEGGQTSGIEIVRAFVQRGELGYKEEAKLVEHAIQIAFLHAAWRFKAFSEEDAADEAKVDALRGMRDAAVGVFQRLALNDRTNAAKPVKRQAFVAFLNVHLLFSERSAAPAAKAAPLKLADDVQHRLSGAFSAAIDDFASDLAEEQARGDEDETEPEPKRDQVDFYQQVSVVIAAIRTGVLEVEHACEPLAHVGRLGPTYDAIVRKLVDVLRDEGIYNRQADTVQHVAFDALEKSFNAYLDSDEHEPTAPLALTKLLASAFTIHGTHFSVLKQLHPSDACDFHLASVDYIVRKITQYVKQERANKGKDVKARIAAKRGQALSFFRCLVPLLGPLNGRDALKVRAQLSEGLEGAGVVVPVGASKVWEGYKTYEKRLLGVAGRDKAVQGASQRVVREGKGAGSKEKEKAGERSKGKSKEMVEDDDEEEEGRQRTETLSPAPQDDDQAAQTQGKEKGQNGKSLQRSESRAAILPADAEEEVGQAEGETEEEGEGEEPDAGDGEEDEEDEGDEEEDTGMDIDLPDESLDLDLDLDADFAGADFPVAASVASGRRSASVEPSKKRRRGNREL